MDEPLTIKSTCIYKIDGVNFHLMSFNLGYENVCSVTFFVEANE